MPLANIDWPAFTHIALAFLTVNSDKSLDDTFGQTTTGAQLAKDLASAAHAHNVKAILSLGGAGSGANIATAARPANRAAFVTALVNAVTNWGYDGIDLDWEDSVNLDDLGSLAQALRAAKPSMIITYPAGALNANIDKVDTRIVTMAQSLDQVNAMTYYVMSGSGWDSWFLSPLSGESPTTPIAIDDTLNRYVTAGIPKSKLGMGIGFWATCYTGVTGPRQATTSGNQVISADTTYPFSLFFAPGGTFAKSTTSNQQRDSIAQVPYLTFPTAVHDTACNADVQFIGYDDETSIIAKGTWSKSHGYGGAIIWTINEGYLPANAAGGRSPNALMEALRQGFLQ